MKAWKKDKKPRPDIQRKGSDAYITYRQCHRKRKYPTEALAEETAEHCEQERGTKLFVYNCPTCSNYHLTHKNTSEGLFYKKSI